MYCDYRSKLLYRQHTISEEGHNVDSAVYALSWRHPASMGSVTTRTRMTIVTNFIDPEALNVFAANIELWRESGWIMLEEYFDDSLQEECYNSRDVEVKCLKVLEAFFVGSVDDDDDVPVSPPPPKKKPTKRAKRTIVTKKPRVEEQSKSEQLPKSEDDPSFDWI